MGLRKIGQVFLGSLLATFRDDLNIMLASELKLTLVELDGVLDNDLYK
jgi:hypothetical protein